MVTTISMEFCLMSSDENDDRPLRNKRSKSRKTSPPPISDDNQALTRREANKARVVSMQQCSVLLGYDRNTVEKWVKQEDCPYISQADRDRGIQWELDLAAVVRWLQERAVRNVVGEDGDGDGSGKMTDSKKRKEAAQAILAELEVAEELGRVVPRQAVLDRIQKDYTEIKKRLMTLPAAIAGRLDASTQRIAREVADDQVRKMLAKLRVEDVVKAAEDRSTDIDDEE
ncbi:terminase small subunit [Agrobacterium tumefaciens]|nr:terminase small subunit [Agrobacterium tumefaciens]